MQHRRKVWQHDVEKISEDQLREFFHTLGWEADRIGDYGEDLFVRIFDQGNATGHDFYLQLKGTPDISQYHLKSGGFSYAVDIAALRHWNRDDFIPIIFVLWDIQQRQGYWLHIQPLIHQKLQHDSHWLDEAGLKRSIHIPQAHMLDNAHVSLLREAIDVHWANFFAAKQRLEQLQSGELGRMALALEGALISTDLAISSSQVSQQVLPNVQQQILITQYEATTAANPADMDAWIKLAAIYYDANELEKALATINRIHELEPSNPRINAIRAPILSEYVIAHNGQPKSMLYEAISLFESLRPYTNVKGVVDYNIGSSLLALEKYQEAITHFDLALAAQPDPQLASQIWKNRGTCYFHLVNHEEEIASYQKALELNSTLWEAYVSWAVTELHLGNFEHAKDLLIQAMQVKPDLGTKDFRHLYSLAFTFWKLGDLAESYQYIKKSLAINPNAVQSQRLKTILISALWRTDETYTFDASAFFKAWLLDHPEDTFARRELYLIYNSSGSADEARALLTEPPPSPDAPAAAFFNFAAMLRDEDKFQEALHYAELAFGKSQEHRIIHLLAHLREETGNYLGAINLYQSILADEPLQVLTSMVDCYYRLGNYQECIRFMVKAIFIDPLNEKLWSNLSHLAAKLSKPKLYGVSLAIQQSVAERAFTADDHFVVKIKARLLKALQTEFPKVFVQSSLSQELGSTYE